MYITYLIIQLLYKHYLSLKCSFAFLMVLFAILSTIPVTTLLGSVMLFLPMHISDLVDPVSCCGITSSCELLSPITTVYMISGLVCYTTQNSQLYLLSHLKLYNIRTSYIVIQLLLDNNYFAQILCVSNEITNYIFLDTSFANI